MLNVELNRFEFYKFYKFYMIYNPERDKNSKFKILHSKFDRVWPLRIV